MLLNNDNEMLIIASITALYYKINEILQQVLYPQYCLLFLENNSVYIVKIIYTVVEKYCKANK